MSIPIGQPEPYPGLHSFQDRASDRLLFRGREKDTQALLNLVLAEDLVLLFSRSGLGKTSLLNAGLKEPLRRLGFFPVMVRLTHNPEGRPLQSVYECVEKEASSPEYRVELRDGAERGTLWEFFHGAQFFHAGKPLRPLLILDQFEELFTCIRAAPHEGPARMEEFIRQLSDLIHHRVPDALRKEMLARLNRLSPEDPARKELVAVLYEGAGPDVNVLLAMREDYLAELETVKAQLPGILRHSFRLEPLHREQARAAIEDPGGESTVLGEDTFTYAPGVVDQMLDFLSRCRVRGIWTSGDCVEPAQLQLLCHHLNNQRRKREAHEITARDLGGDSGMRRIIRHYYVRSFRRFPWLGLGWSGRGWRPSRTNLLLCHRLRLAVRQLCEEGLITPDGHRNSLEISSVQQRFGVREHEANRLVDLKLVRGEDRLGSRFYELSHDSLIEPVRASRRRRRWRVFAQYAGTALAMWLGFLVFIAHKKTQQMEMQRYYAQQIRQSSRVLEQSSKALEQAVQRQAPTNLTRVSTTNLNLSDQRLPGVSFTEANLPNGAFSNSVLYRANFTGAQLLRAKFDMANLDEGQFVNALLAQASFRNASAANADFSKAVLTGVDFTAANLSESRFTNAVLRQAILRDTRFKGAFLDGAEFTDTEMRGADFVAATLGGATFTNANWWMAYWSQEALSNLRQRWPVDAFANSTTYRQRRAQLERAPSQVKSPQAQAEALRELAWYLATHGPDREQAQAHTFAARSLGYLPENIEALDTCGFVRLRLGQNGPAYTNFTAAVQRSDSAGYAFYHLGLACERLNRLDEAGAAFQRADELQYRPSYELVFTPRRPLLRARPTAPSNLRVGPEVDVRRSPPSYRTLKR